MSSRGDTRRRDGSRERNDRDRYSRGGRGRGYDRRRSRSPDRRPSERHGRDRDYGRRRDYSRERDYSRDKDYGRDRDYDRDREKEDRYRRGSDRGDPRRQSEKDTYREREPRDDSPNVRSVKQDADGPEEGQEMDAEDDDEAAMMAMMGMSGFGSTKGKQVEGNQEGSVEIKKQRTWRQYMNRRGGFNRPLDKIK